MNNKSAWFSTVAQCPYSGLKVTNPAKYVSNHPKAHYFVDVAKLGDRVLLIKASGYVRSYEMTEALRFMDEYVSTHFDAGTGVFMVEDYADVEGADPEARRAYIRHHKTSAVIWGGVLFNLPLLFRISFNIAKRLHVHDKLLYAAESYPQAIALTLEVMRSRNTGEGLSRDQNSEFLTFLEKSSEKASQLYRSLTDGIQKFSRSAVLMPARQIRRQNTEALLKYIESIDWHTDGIKDPDGKIFSDPLMKQVAAAISYIKSEIDDLLRERDAKEKILKEKEAQYRRLVEHARAGILEFDHATNRIVSVNDSFLDICGYSKAEITAQNPEDLMTESSRKLFQDRMKMRMKGMSLPDDAVYEFFTKSGEKKWVLLTANIIQKAGRPQKADIIIIDITPIKAAETRLMEYQARLKALAVELSKTEERQRRELASQLHEGVSQELFAAQLKIAVLEKSLTDPGQRRRLGEINTQIVKSMREIKSITYDLSPPVLYDLGLPEALESLARIFESRHKLNVTVEFKGESGNCTNEIKQIIYRVVREILQNTVKHALTDRAAIFVERTENDLFVEVTDNGIGFDTSVVAENHYNGEGFGLFDIREKISYLGGDLRICSTSGEGTRISLAVPLNPS